MMLAKKERKVSKGREIKTHFDEVRDKLGRLFPQLGNVTFSIAPEENLDALDVFLNADGSPSKRPITSAENSQKVISQIKKEEKAIRFPCSKSHRYYAPSNGEWGGRPIGACYLMVPDGWPIY